MTQFTGSSSPLVLGLSKFPYSKFTDKTHTDLTIRCQGREFYAHKIILATKSGFFFKACDPKSPWIEARTGVINLNEEHPVMVEAMLEFCYRGEESSFLDTVVGKLGGDGAEAELRFYVHLNAMGDKYQIEPLKYHAFRHFEELATESFNAQYTGYGKPITPAGVARIARDILETTHDTDSSSDYPLRIFFLCELSQRVDTFRRSKRFTAEADRIDGFWETTSKVNAEFGYRLRHCLVCGHLQAEDLRLKVSCLILCTRCGQSSNAIAWNKHNSRIDATAMEPDTESEEERSGKKSSKSKKQGA
ncbi:uncharacterized protein J3D65DRAFT_605750 [Phyllosticta citribraziliensis]|uniref:BTB domain-containing protein n=1 Tax=Phyllosticta citribraziliensis TaxID=989973 RepID=A0ABR1LH38_9PEZI